MSYSPLIRHVIRQKSSFVPACFLALAIPLAVWDAPPARAQGSQPASAVVLDRVVAVVNQHAILASDLREEMQLAILDPNQSQSTAITPSLVLEQLIGRTLIEQQIRQEDMPSVDPSPTEVDVRLAEIRKELPACVRHNCASEAGWKAFLATNSLTQEQVENYLRHRLQILQFIELRFRQGISISPQEIESYYRQTLLPQYPAGETIPALDLVAPRIQEILLQRQVNVLLDDWLQNLRKQGEVEVLDPSLEAPQNQDSGKEGSR